MKYQIASLLLIVTPAAASNTKGITQASIIFFAMIIYGALINWDSKK